MKITRLSLLSLALVMSLLTVPGAFGKGRNGGGVGSSLNKNSTACDGDYYIWCYYEPIEACCYGSHDGCLGACEDLCGGPCDDYTNEA